MLIKINSARLWLQSNLNLWPGDEEDKALTMNVGPADICSQRWISSRKTSQASWSPDGTFRIPQRRSTTWRGSDLIQHSAGINLHSDSSQQFRGRCAVSGLNGEPWSPAPAHGSFVTHEVCFGCFGIVTHQPGSELSQFRAHSQDPMLHCV